MLPDISLSLRDSAGIHATTGRNCNQQKSTEERSNEQRRVRSWLLTHTSQDRELILAARLRLYQAPHTW